MYPGGDGKNTVSGSSSGDGDGAANDTESEVETRQDKH